MKLIVSCTKLFVEFVTHIVHHITKLTWFWLQVGPNFLQHISFCYNRNLRSWPAEKKNGPPEQNCKALKKLKKITFILMPTCLITLGKLIPWFEWGNAADQISQGNSKVENSMFLLLLARKWLTLLLTYLMCLVKDPVSLTNIQRRMAWE